MQPETPSYIVREADRELYEHAMAGDFCYVLTSRQMGKSSLMARTDRYLRAQGRRTAILDLTRIGTDKSSERAADAWYYGVMHRILRSLGSKIHLPTWWQERKGLPAIQRLTECFDDLVRTHTSERLVIFVDEVDTTIVLPFTDDFFAAIRACYNARATEPAYRRLSFVLLGVASPSQLIKGSWRTPFNIGHRIDLTDFTFDEARPLAHGLGGDHASREKMLQRVLYWTGGHPYLTQKLCYVIAEERLETYADDTIDRLVEKFILAPETSREEHNLNFVRDRFTRDRAHRKSLLRRYRRICLGKTVSDDPRSPVITALKLSGVVVSHEDRTLRVRNRIYERVFTAQWAKDAMPRDWNRRIGAVAVTILVLGFGFWYTRLLPRQYIQTLRVVSEDYALASDAYKRLRTIPGYAGQAADLLAEFWERRAIRAEARGDRDEALLLRLRALAVQPTVSRRSAVGNLAGADYQALLATYRHKGEFGAVAFSPDGQTLLTGSGDGTGRLWRVGTGVPLGQPLRHEAAVRVVAFSPDGRTVATGSEDGLARLWRTETGAPIGQTLRHEAAVGAVAFSPDGQTVVTGSQDGVVRVWQAETGLPIGQALHHEAAVGAVAFSPDGRAVLTGDVDGTVQVWQVETGAPLGPLLRHRLLMGGTVAFSPDGRTVVIGSQDGTARLWRVETGMPIGQPLRHEAAVGAVAFSPDGQTVVTGSQDGTARLWRAETGVLLGQPLHHEAAVGAVAFSPDGQTIVTGSQDETARLWRVEMGLPVNRLLRHEATIRAIAFSPDGRAVLTGDVDGTVRLWQVETGAPLGLLLHHEAAVGAVAFSPDGQTIVAGSQDGTARLWRVETGVLLGQPLRHEAAVGTVAFSPDGRAVLTEGVDRTVQVWQVETGAPLGPLLRHRLLMGGAVAFSPDGRTVVTGGADRTARLWLVETGAPMGQPLPHAAPVRVVAFSPDGRTVGTGSVYGTVRLWQVETEAPLGPLLHHTAPVRALAFSPDGSTLLTAAHRWLHLSIVENNAFKSKASRLLAGGWIGAYHFLDKAGNQVQVASLITGDTVKIDTLQFDISYASLLIPGDPETLLKEWQQKLARTFDEEGKLVSLWPAGVTR